MVVVLNNTVSDVAVKWNPPMVCAGVTTIPKCIHFTLVRGYFTEVLTGGPPKTNSLE